MDRFSRGLVEVGLGLGVGVAPTLVGVALIALGMASSPFVQGLMAELVGPFSLNLLLSIVSSPVVVLGLLDFRSGLRSRVEVTDEKIEETEVSSLG